MQALHIHWLSGRSHLTPLGVVLAAAALLCTAWVVQDYVQADAEWQSLQTGSFLSVLVTVGECTLLVKSS